MHVTWLTSWCWGGRWRPATWVQGRSRALAPHCPSPSFRALPAQVLPAVHPHRPPALLQPPLEAHAGCMHAAWELRAGWHTGGDEHSASRCRSMAACTGSRCTVGAAGHSQTCSSHLAAGKTHTVKGVLNVWHMVAYQRYYNALVTVLSADAKSGLNLDSFNSALERKCAAHGLPAILVLCHCLDLAVPVFHAASITCTTSLRQGSTAPLLPEIRPVTIPGMQMCCV